MLFSTGESMLFSVATRRPKITIPIPRGAIRFLVFMDDRTVALSLWGMGYCIQIWDLMERKLARILKDPGHTATWNRLDYCPRTQMLAMGGNRCKISLWNRCTDQMVVLDHTPISSHFTFSPDGRFLACQYSKKKQIAILDVPIPPHGLSTNNSYDGLPQKLLDIPDDFLSTNAISFTADATKIVVGCVEHNYHSITRKVIWIWDTSSGNVVSRLDGKLPIFSPDWETRHTLIVSTLTSIQIKFIHS